MPLILAIEPDRRQANQLNAVVKGRLHADLVLADSAERALKELGDRVPDLILTSALLSPTDEVVLGDRLRKLNGVAAHVQTLTIPVLAGPRPRARARAGGMLSALRRGKSQDDATPDGCDPTVFAAQCAEYLERARAEQAINIAADQHKTAIDDHIEDIAAPVVEIKTATAEVEAIREFEPVDEMVEIAPPEPAAFTRSTNPFMADPVAAPPPAANTFASETFAAEKIATERVAADPFATERYVAEPVTAHALSSARVSSEPGSLEPIAEPVFAAEPMLAGEPVAADEPAVQEEPVRQPVDTPLESFATRRREPATPVFIDANAAAASVSEAIAQIEAFVARESLASETIAKLEADEFAETTWETASSAWEAEPRGAEPIGNDDSAEAPVPEGFIELDLSTLLEDPQVDTPKQSDDDEQAVLKSSQFDSDEEPFVFDINEFNEFLIAASKPAVKTSFMTNEVAAAAEPAITVEKAPEHIEIETPVTPAPLVESPSPAGALRNNPLLTPSRLGVSHLWPNMDGVVAEAQSLDMIKDGRAATATLAPAKRASGRHKPIQDEWGFFDPEQCGFAALLAKLDEIIDTDDRPA